MTQRCLLIEGVPYAWGEYVPSWSECKLLSGIGLERVQINRSIDPLGGVQKTDDVEFKLVDTADEYANDGERLAGLFRWYNDAPAYVISPNPLTYDYSGSAITLDTDVHPTIKAWYADGSGYRQSVSSKYFDIINKDWTFEAWIKDAIITDAIYFARNNQIVIQQVGANIEVQTYDGSWHTITGADTITAGAWYHLTVTQVSDVTTIYLNNTADVHTSTYYPSVKLDTAAEYAYDCEQVTWGSAAFWSRALSAAEVGKRILGQPIDPTGLICEYDMKPGTGRNWYDKSGAALHSTATADAGWVSRQYLPGDLLYLPSGTARITTRTGSTTYQIVQQVYSCLEDGYCPFYATVYPNDFVAEISTESPIYWAGRLCAYYEDGNLLYIGRIQDVQQNGKEWGLRTADILQPLTDGIKPASLTVNQASDWIVSGLVDQGFQYSAEGGVALSAWSETGTQAVSIPDGLYTLSDLAAHISEQLTDPLWSFNPNNGYVFNHDDITSVTVSTQTAHRYFFDGYPALEPNSTGTWCSFSSGHMPLYGAIIGGYLYFTLDSTAEWIQDGATVTWFDHTGQEYQADILNYNTVTGACTIGNVYKAGTNEGPAALFIKQDTPICYTISPAILVTSLHQLIYGLLTSTGASSNGSYDTFIGLQGLGLPSELIDTTYTTDYQGHGFKWDPSKGKLADSLSAFGLALVFRDNKYRIIRVKPPQNVQIKASIEDMDCDIRDLTKAAWGYHRPMSLISLTLSNVTYRVNAITGNIWEASQLRSKEYKDIVASGINLADWLYLQGQRLQWFGHYAPSLRVNIINHTLQLGDIVGINARYMAGKGRYGVKDIPAIVTKLSGDWTVEMVLNTDPNASAAIWVPSWEIESYTGAVLTLRYPEGLLLSDVVDFPATMQIIESDGTVINASVTATGCTASTITLAAAPTYTQTQYRGILTLPNYTSALSADQSYYVWACASDVMSNSDAGKKLL